MRGNFAKVPLAAEHRLPSCTTSHDGIQRRGPDNSDSDSTSRTKSACREMPNLSCACLISQRTELSCRRVATAMSRTLLPVANQAASRREETITQTISMLCIQKFIVFDVHEFGL